MTSTATIYSPTGECRTLEANAAASEVRKDPREWSFTKPAPVGWDRETPRYRVTIQGGVYPSPNSRFRFEPPFASCSDNSVWQYAARPHNQGEIIETREWPHASFCALNYAAEKVLDYFRNHSKSRLPRSPWQDGRVRLSDGLSGSGIQPIEVRPEKFDARPSAVATGFQPSRKISAA
ncbi:hypothetical protein [Bradyrhizobium japonicum]|uniref:hypothetical protein n=1 Tax=Bradyrhizobium japonicum TaxID=375 RepID=UPI001B8A0F7B|nr:hypothetical protein [Bradyrhizobium japonicum]MBR0974092.1 hypothetical protein [Bradyrhizobium japonicum]